MPWGIEANVGVGVLRFGMSPDEVHGVLGEPRMTRPGLNRDARSRLGLQEIYAPGIALTYEQEGDGRSRRLALVAIGFGKESRELSYAGVKLFEVSRRDAIERLAADDPDVQETLGFLVFPKLGISLTGFYDRNAQDLAVNISAPGQWDRHRGTMKPFKD